MNVTMQPEATRLRVWNHDVNGCATGARRCAPPDLILIGLSIALCIERSRKMYV
jgi:hypothetical protein